MNTILNGMAGRDLGGGGGLGMGRGFNVCECCRINFN